MRKVYRVLAFVVAGLVVVQAAAIAYAVFGLSHWIESGGSLDAAAMQSEQVTFDGVVGFMVHGIAGTAVIPLVVLLLLVTSFFAKTPQAVRWALVVLAATVVQIALGLLAHAVPALGLLHGAVALVLFGAAVMAGLRAKPSAPAGVGARHADTAPLATA